MTIAEHEREARRILTKARADSPGLCARLLTARVLGLDKTAYVLASQQEMPEAPARLLRDLISRRASGEPLAYIIGEKEFYGISFKVSVATLVPRPETELLVELALSLLPEGEPLTFADLGCGSGCIGLTLLRLRRRWRGLLLDNSSPALEIAKINGEKLQCSARLILGDMRKAPLAPAAFDLVVSNPPYIGEEERHLVMGETLAHEPHCALFSSSNGTAHLLAAVAAAQYSLKEGGLALFEHGAGQHEFMQMALQNAGFTHTWEEKDLAGIYRCSAAYKGERHGGIEGLQPV